jgi:hypothetical protein
MEGPGEDVVELIAAGVVGAAAVGGEIRALGALGPTKIETVLIARGVVGTSGLGRSARGQSNQTEGATRGYGGKPCLPS